MREKQMTLMSFVKDECANFGKHYQLCADDKPCRVLAGERCGYFERRVLGPPNYKYKLPDYDYQKLFAQYAEQTKAENQIVEQRLCGCGNPLKLRQRYCETCRRNRRQKTKRENQQRFRRKQRVCA